MNDHYTYRVVNLGNNHLYIETEFTPRTLRLCFDLELTIEYGATFWLGLSLGPFSASLFIRRPIIPVRG